MGLGMDLLPCSSGPLVHEGSSAKPKIYISSPFFFSKNDVFFFKSIHLDKLQDGLMSFLGHLNY